MSREISHGRWNDVARAIFGFQVRKPLELEDLIRPGVVLESDRPEWRYVAGSMGFRTIRTTEGPVVGQFSAVALYVPLAAGIIVVVTDIQRTTGAVGELDLAVGAIDALPGGIFTTAIPDDTRWLNVGNAVDGPGISIAMGFQIITRSSATRLSPGTTHQSLQASALTGQWSRLHHPQVVGPGGFCGVETQATNLTTGPVTFYGYVKPLSSGKRA